MILVDLGMYYAAIVVLAISLLANIIQAGLVVRWKQTADQYKGMWKDATTKIAPCNPYEKKERSIKYEYLEGLD